VNPAGAIYHYLFTTPFGKSSIIYKKNPFSIVQVLLPRPNLTALAADADRAGWGRDGFHRQAVALAGRIVRYFEGVPLQLSEGTWEILNMEGVTPLQRSVLAATAKIPYGQLRSYRALAQAVGRPKAYRFVGGTMAANPFPVLIPCHRVVRSDGTLGGFGGGLDLKRRMIDMETAHLRVAPDFF
jgi:methylated-DNA-[protein]-cysteine S-methyltransferase